jgi:NAD(P)H-dependent FMN reductase
MASTAPKKVAIIIGSTRPVRAGPTVVDFVQRIISTSPSFPKITLSTLDIATFNLPIFNEPLLPAMIPAMGQYTHAHSIAWSQAIAPFDGYIIVSPEYNFGVPASVKNAIDYVYNEWIGKPILIVTYGIQGAKQSSAQLETIFTGMKLRVAETKPQLAFRKEEQMMPIGKGELGPLTIGDWEKDGSAPLLKGFEELIEKLEKPVEEEKAKDA